MFTQYPFLARFEQASRSSFKGVECWFPYEWKISDLAEQLDKHDLELVLLNVPPGDWNAGDRGLACLPKRQKEFRQNISLAIEYAQSLKCGRLHCPVGIASQEATPQETREILIDNLRFAAAVSQKAGVKMLIEPLSIYSCPGYYLTNTADAIQLIHDVGHPNLWLQYDVYHMQIMEGNLIRTILDNLPLVAHIQIADNPGRHEPGTGEVNFHNLLLLIDEAGYDGWIGCEYIPNGDTLDSLRWAGSYLRQQN